MTSLDLDPHKRQAQMVIWDLMPVLNEERTAKAGSPQYDNVEYVEIYTQGDRNNIPHLPATDKHRKKFAVSYDAFKRGLEAPLEGTPLTEWAQATPADIKMLKALKPPVQTIEALASMPDQWCERNRGTHPLRKKAVIYLTAASNEGATSEKMVKLEQKLETMEEANLKLLDVVAELKEALEKEPPPPEKVGGRRKKG